MYFIGDLLATGNFNAATFPPGMVVTSSFQDPGIHYRNIFQIHRCRFDVPIQGPQNRLKKHQSAQSS